MDPFQPGILCDPVTQQTINSTVEISEISACLHVPHRTGHGHVLTDARSCAQAQFGNSECAQGSLYSFICQTTLFLQLSLCLLYWKFSLCRSSGWEIHCHCHRGGSSSCYDLGHTYVLGIYPHISFLWSIKILKTLETSAPSRDMIHPWPSLKIQSHLTQIKFQYLELEWRLIQSMEIPHW